MITTAPSTPLSLSQLLNSGIEDYKIYWRRRISILRKSGENWMYLKIDKVRFVKSALLNPTQFIQKPSVTGYYFEVQFPRSTPTTLFWFPIFPIRLKWSTTDNRTKGWTTTFSKWTSGRTILSIWKVQTFTTLSESQ